MLVPVRVYARLEVQRHKIEGWGEKKKGKKEKTNIPITFSMSLPMRVQGSGMVSRTLLPSAMSQMLMVMAVMHEVMLHRMPT